eukprot:TRINITY_DN3025_c0_g1_i1.p1 TRINITY_DN3025_c0_g1~~TRINITY_DN3025_c0_g1_i1.p1  ORF type:complete len:169 (+),score=46.13 TRINITY_DN3025_c0_g1_i1:330-836(+)
MSKAGDSVPEGKFSFLVPSDANNQDVCTELKRISTKDWKGKRVVVFGVPGAFTPTCHQQHLPGFVEKYREILDKNVDEIVMICANDPWVNDAWRRETKATGKVTLLCDPDCTWAKKTGLSVDLSEYDLGVRHKRFVALIQDETFKILDVEEGTDDVTLSGAQHILPKL